MTKSKPGEGIIIDGHCEDITNGPKSGLKASFVVKAALASGLAIGGITGLTKLWNAQEVTCGGNQNTGYFVGTRGGDVLPVGRNYFRTDTQRGICITALGDVLLHDPALLARAPGVRP